MEFILWIDPCKVSERTFRNAPLAVCTHMLSFHSFSNLLAFSKSGCNLFLVINVWGPNRYTEDINQAFIVNMATRKIEPIIFNVIRYYAET